MITNENYLILTAFSEQCAEMEHGNPKVCKLNLKNVWVTNAHGRDY